MISCDEVFEVLTRGPFPTGASSDVIVEAHLARCAECRRLAEALQPAVELFREGVAPEEGRNLPSYEGAFYESAVRAAAAERAFEYTRGHAEGFAGQLAPAPRRRLGINERLLENSVRFTAAVVLGALVAVFIHGLGWAFWHPDQGAVATAGQPPLAGSLSSPSTADPVTFASVDAPLALDARIPPINNNERAWLLNIGLPEGCLGLPAARESTGIRPTSGPVADAPTRLAAAIGQREANCCKFCHPGTDLVISTTSVDVETCRRCH